MKTRVRKVTPSHIADMIRIGEETNLSPWTAQNYLDELQTSGSVMLALESDVGKMIGFVVGRIIADTEAAPPTAEIYNIAVDPVEKGKGCGQLLYDEFLSECGVASAAEIWLEVRESNHPAIAFYTRNGFEPIQTRPNFYRDPREHAILMRCLLKKPIA